MGLLEQVLVLIEVQGEPSLKNITKAMTKLGYNLRLTGRDLMRMSSSLQRMGQFFMSFAQRIFSSSDIVTDAFEDIGFALEDAMEAAGLLEPFVEFLESIAEWIEANPWIAWIIGISAVVGVFFILLSKIVQVVGFMTLLSGTILSAKTANLGLIDTLRLIIVLLSGKAEAMKRDIAETVRAQEEQKKLNVAMQKGSKITGQKGRAEKKAASRQKKQQKGWKGLLKTGAKWIGGLAAMGVGFLVLGQVLEAASPILEAVGEAFEDVFDALEETGVIDWIVDFIQNNKELVVGVLVAVAALPLLLSGVKALGPLLGKLTGKFKGVSDVLTGVSKGTDQTSSGLWKTLLAVAAILPGIVGLVYAFSDFLKVVAETGFTFTDIIALLAILVGNVGAVLAIIVGLSRFMKDLNQTGWGTVAMIAVLMGGAIALALAFTRFLEVAHETGFNVAEIAGILGTLTGAIIGVIAAITVATFILAGLSVTAAMALPVVALMLGLGAAALMVGAGFMLAGLGIKYASEGIALLVGYLPQVIALVPALFGIALAFTAVGISALTAMGGIFGMAAAVFMLAAALGALTIPLGIIRAIGGTGAVMEAIRKIPSFAEGAMITQPGLAVVHGKELVTPAKGKPLPGVGYKTKEPPMTVTVDITGAESIDEIIRRSVEAATRQVSEKMERRYRMSEY